MTSQDSTATSRYCIGIDLGTTNCSLCYIDLESTDRAVRIFDIPQLIAPGETAAEPLLPSFTYLPGEHEIPDGALKLPWTDGDAPLATGRFAREQGARIPERMISSAKSWLAHAGVDRTRPILPWGGELGSQMASPVDVSVFYLEHLRSAWDHVFRHKRDREGTPCLLADQQVIVTVPASFDEVARELTIQAARRAGFRNLTLIEEPLAAFYAWLNRHEADWQTLVAPGDVIVVIDVGGGTTDFSLVELDDKGTLRRKAVGNHLLLGGDNMDMALARQAETAWKTRLNQRQWTMLCQECRRVKELLLGDNPPESAKVQLTGSGSAVIAGNRTHEFKRDAVQSLILDSFFTDIPVDSAEPERRKGIQDMGLPYAADPTVTRHLLQFLRHAGKSLSTPSDLARPTKVLFNGGTMIPAILRQRVMAILRNWTGNDSIIELEATDFSLAVSQGAATYGLARAGETIRVKGGIANAYYLEIQTEHGPKLICVMPRDTDEGVICRLDRPFSLQTNTPVAFPLLASSTRLGDALGDILGEDQDITRLPPLCTSLHFGNRDEKKALGVTLASRLNEVGTLEVWCQSTTTEHRFPLTFELRQSSAAQPGNAGIGNAATVEASRQEAAATLLHGAFSGTGHLESLVKEIEAAIDLPRLDWPAVFLRHVADDLIDHAEWRQTDSAHEARWLNLCSFCMRPGFGVVGDSDRIRKLWKLWHGGALHGTHADVRESWWLLWRRVSGGLSSGQQSQIAGILGKELIGKDRQNSLKKDDPATLEQWRVLSVLEKLPSGSRLKFLTALLKESGKLFDQAFWPLARLASRRLFAGPDDSVIPAAKLEPLLTLILQKADQAHTPATALMAIAGAARQTGNRVLDLPSGTRDRLVQYLQTHGASESLLEPVLTLQTSENTTWQPELLGDVLPLGLSLT